jgi:hypothetical protein
MRPCCTILAVLIAGSLAGCVNQTIRSRQFALHIPTTSAVRSVALVELVEQSGGGDCPRFDPEKVLHVSIVESDASGQLRIEKPSVHSDVWWLGMRRRERFARWTIFQRGAVVTTIYPEGRDIWDSGVDVPAELTPKLGWCAPYVTGDRYDELRPNQKLGTPYLRDDGVVKMEIQLRSLPTPETRLEPDPNWQNAAVAPPRAGLCPADAATLQWQVNQLLDLVRQRKLRHLSAGCRETILTTVEEQSERLKSAGLRIDTAPELDRACSELRVLLSKG